MPAAEVTAKSIEKAHGVDNAAAVKAESSGDARGAKRKFHQWDARGDRKKSIMYPTQAELRTILFDLAAESQEQYEEVPLLRNNPQGFMMKLMPEIAKKYKDLQQLTFEDLTTEQFRTNISDAAETAYDKWC
jgi:hypothetical protein